MAIEFEWTDPSTARAVPGAYAWMNGFRFDALSRSILLDVLVHPTPEAAAAGLPARAVVTVAITGDEFDAHVAANRAVYGALQAAVDAALAARPATFPGATVLPPAG